MHLFPPGNVRRQVIELLGHFQPLVVIVAIGQSDPYLPFPFVKLDLLFDGLDVTLDDVFDDLVVLLDLGGHSPDHILYETKHGTANKY